MNELDPAAVLTRLDGHVRTGFSELDQRLREQGVMLARIEERQISQQAAIDTHHARIGALEMRMTSVERRVDENARTSSVVTRVSWLAVAAFVSGLIGYVVNRWMSP